METVTVEAQGNRFEVKRHQYKLLYQQKYTGGNKRDVITKFSQDSQLRLMKLVASIGNKQVKQTRCRPVFLTLTYAGNMQKFKQAKRDLKVFLQRIARLHEEASAIWKMELQERGAIHFHLIVYGLPYTPVQTLQTYWNEITGESSENSVDIEVIRSSRGVMYYVSKYICKGEDTKHEKELNKNATKNRDALVGLSMPHNRPSPHVQCGKWKDVVKVQPESTGRWWGVHNRKELPLAPLKKHHTSIADYAYTNWVSSLRENYAARYKSFTVFTGKAYAYFWRFQQAVKEDWHNIERQNLNKLTRGEYIGNTTRMNKPTVADMTAYKLKQGLPENLWDTMNPYDARFE